ncbi:MAG: hypothetical protein LRZ88_11500 [Candidatus Cloacimonetes bacterium]|nr:hypothetical protein [Candidatus Cloacimonadota bacterium]
MLKGFKQINWIHTISIPVLIKHAEIIADEIIRGSDNSLVFIGHFYDERGC